jgi:Pyrimidine 5'-nucleotidase (UMPH-1)
VDQVEERLVGYVDAFDIVLVNDQSMDIPNAILRMVLEDRLRNQVQANNER